MSSCCVGCCIDESTGIEYLKVIKTKNSCSNCEKYVEKNVKKTFAVVSCEGACLRGEISRRIANIICHEISPEKTVRICQGSALSKDGGQRRLVQNASKVVFLEGCFLKCASRLFGGFDIAGEKTIVITDSHAEFDKTLFSSNELSDIKIDEIAHEEANFIFDNNFR